MTGHLVKRGKKYSVVLEVGNGTRKQRWLSGFPTEQAANDALERAKAEAVLGIFTEPSSITVGKWLDQWQAEFCLHLSPYTARSYRDTVERVKRLIGGARLQQITPVTIQQIILGWQDEFSPSTIRRHIACLSSAFNKAVELGLITKNPARGVSLPRVDRLEPKTLSAAEASRLLKEAAFTPVYIPCCLALLMGMRRGEILALRWKDIDLDNGTITVARTAVTTGTGRTVYKEPKTGRTRVLAVPGGLVDILRARKDESWYAERGDISVVLDMTPQQLSTAFARFAQKHGFDVTFHGLRHTHASLLLEAGVNMKVTQERLGHSKMSTTSDTYSHTSAGMQKAAAEAMERMLG